MLTMQPRQMIVIIPALRRIVELFPFPSPNVEKNICLVVSKIVKRRQRQIQPADITNEFQVKNYALGL